MDQIIIKDLELYAFHGVNPEENTLGQKFILSLTLDVDFYQAGAADDLNQTINYGELCKFVEAEFTKTNRKLIEACVQELAEQILFHYPLVKSLSLTLKKPWAPIGSHLAYAAVSACRGWHTAYIGLGSNLGDREATLKEAIRLLDMPKTQIIRTSLFYETKPVGYIDQPDFLNCALQARTLLPPPALLARLQEIEQQLGRTRTIHWGPRTADLDLLLYDEEILTTDALVLPHPRMAERMFVLEPLAEIAPYALHPLTGKRIFQLKEALASSSAPGL